MPGEGAGASWRGLERELAHLLGSYFHSGTWFRSSGNKGLLSKGPTPFSFSDL